MAVHHTAVILARAPRWEALYLNGHLRVEDVSLSVDTVLDIVADLKTPIVFDIAFAADVYEALGAWCPPRLSDLKLNKETI